MSKNKMFVAGVLTGILGLEAILQLCGAESVVSLISVAILTALCGVVCMALRKLSSGGNPRDSRGVASVK